MSDKNNAPQDKPATPMAAGVLTKVLEDVYANGHNASFTCVEGGQRFVYFGRIKSYDDTHIVISNTEFNSTMVLDRVVITAVMVKGPGAPRR